MKSVALTSLALLFATGLAACGGGSSAPAASPTPPPVVTTGVDTPKAVSVVTAK